MKWTLPSRSSSRGKGRMGKTSTTESRRCSPGRSLYCYRRSNYAYSINKSHPGNLLTSTIDASHSKTVAKPTFHAICLPCYRHRYQHHHHYLHCIMYSIPVGFQIANGPRGVFATRYSHLRPSLSPNEAPIRIAFLSCLSDVFDTPQMDLVIPVDLGCVYVCLLLYVFNVAIVLYSVESLVSSGPSQSWTTLKM